MTFLLDDWLNELIIKIKNVFAEKIVFIGLQGSYKRKEADDGSDIDIVVILNTLTLQDLEKYKAIIAKMPYKEKACGFISGQKEIICWDKSELFQFYYDTKPIYGNLDYLLPLIEKTEIKRAIKKGACNLYHVCCHNFIYEKNVEILIALYKSAFFILQAKYFHEKGHYISSKAELVKHLQGLDVEILNICINRKRLKTLDESELSIYADKILIWSSCLLQSY